LEAERKAPRRRFPLWSPATARSSSSAAVMCPSAASVCPSRRFPASVTVTGRVPRLKSVSPSSRSSDATWCETTDCVYPSSRAAVEKEPVRATVGGCGGACGEGGGGVWAGGGCAAGGGVFV
jgi:hypothetical protein